HPHPPTAPGRGSLPLPSGERVGVRADECAVARQLAAFLHRGAAGRQPGQEEASGRRSMRRLMIWPRQPAPEPRMPEFLVLPDWPLLAPFLVAALALNLTPGADMTYVLARSVTQGRGAGMLSSLGIAT